MRLIPGKTKVRIELFKGVSIGDVVVVTLGAALVILFAISSLPWKIGICIAIAFITFFLVLRIDDESNYTFVLRMLKYLVLPRRFYRVYTDKMLLDKASGKLREEVIEEYRKENEGRKKRRKKKEAPEDAGEQPADDQIPGDDIDLDSLGEKLISETEKNLLYPNPDTEDQENMENREDTDLPDLSDVTGVWDEDLSEITENPKAEQSETAVAADEGEETAGEEGMAPAGEDRAVFEEETTAGEMAAPEQDAEPVLTEKEKKKALKALIKEENRILKSKTATEEEKNAVWQARADRSALKKKEREEAKEEAGGSGEFMENLSAFTDIKEDFIEYDGKYYGSVIEIDPLEFRFFSKHRRNNSIENCLGKILRSVQEGEYANIVKIDRPVMYDDYMAREYGRLDQLKASYESGMLSEDELKARVEILYDRINNLTDMCFENKVITPFYYLVLFEKDKGRLNLITSNALHYLSQGEMTARRLGTRDIAVFLKYTNQLDFEEREIDRIAPEDYAQWAMPEMVKIKFRDSVVSNILTHTYRVVSYPTLVGDAFMAGVMSIPGTKVVLKATPVDRTKAITGVDRALQELRSQYSNTNIDSKLIELGQHITSLSTLLSTLQGDNEMLMDVNVYVTAYDIAATRMDLSINAPKKSSLPIIGEMDKIVRQMWSEANIRLGRMDFDQLNGFIASQVSAYDPMKKLARGIPSNSVAAAFPWIYSHISDQQGFKMGSAEGVPVFIDFFRRDDERINSNMVIIGKSGSGKSYATKSLLSNLAADDAKIFILDPENEYQELANNLHGKIINVGNAQYGRLNPFHIITALDDDEEEQTEGAAAAVTGSFATHLQFLEEFFRQILPDCEKDALEYLNSLVERMYTNRGIYAETDLSAFEPEDYPIFDDLYDEVLAEFERTENEYLRTMLRTLINYIAKFSTGGRNANIWNGPSTVTTDENFTVFNFQSMLSNRNTTIANAQMLLVLKYIDNEIIKNREYNTRYGLNRKIVVVIDEAHVFIDEKFPIALDFMFQLAKRIRKYNGMQIVITQNIKDFVGSEELARKSTAIINACQYSFIFALAPNDIHDLCKLYEKAGGINPNEQEQIMQAPRGQAFTVLSASSRSTFQVEVPPTLVDMFQQKEYISHYFVGDEGYQNWENYVAASRSTHDLAVATNKAVEEKKKENKPAKKAVTFSIISEEELAAQKLAASRSADAQADESVTFSIGTEEDAKASALSDQEMDLDPMLLDDDMSDDEFDAMIAEMAAKKAAAGIPQDEEADGSESVYHSDMVAAEDTGLVQQAVSISQVADEKDDVSADDDDVTGYAAEGAARTAAAAPAATRSGRQYKGQMAGGMPAAAKISGFGMTDADLEVDALRRELMLERNRLESERLETQRKTVELEKAALEAQKNAGIQDAVLKLGEMLQLMQQQLILTQTNMTNAVPGAYASMQVPGTSPASPLHLAAAVQAAGPSSGIPDTTAALAAGAAAISAATAETSRNMELAAAMITDTDEEETDSMFTTGQDEETSGDDDIFGLGSLDEEEDAERFSDEDDDIFGLGSLEDEEEEERFSDEDDDIFGFGSSDDDDDEEGVELPDIHIDELDEDSLVDLDEFEDDEDEDEDEEDEDLWGDDDDDEEDLDLPDEDEFEKFLFGDDDDDEDEDEDDDDESSLSFNIFDMFEQEAEMKEKYNPMDDFMDGEENVLEITIEQLTEYNKNHKLKAKAG